MKVSCQFALYPLKQENVGEVLGETMLELDRLGISYQLGKMSTEIRGEEDQVFCALRRAFHQAASHGEIVLVATVSNACG